MSFQDIYGSGVPGPYAWQNQNPNGVTNPVWPAIGDAASSLWNRFTSLPGVTPADAAPVVKDQSRVPQGLPAPAPAPAANPQGPVPYQNAPFSSAFAQQNSPPPSAQQPAAPLPRPRPPVPLALSNQQAGAGAPLNIAPSFAGPGSPNFGMGPTGTAQSMNSGQPQPAQQQGLIQRFVNALRGSNPPQGMNPTSQAMQTAQPQQQQGLIPKLMNDFQSLGSMFGGNFGAGSSNPFNVTGSLF